MMLECEITDGSITFLSFFTEDGINVVIEAIDGSQWSDFVSPEYPSMPFDGESGEYSIECTSTDGRVYVGEFEL